MESLPLDTTALLILFARVGAVLMLLPVFSEESVPGRIRLLIALATTTGLYGILSPRVTPFAGDAAALPGILVAELLVGLALGYEPKQLGMSLHIASTEWVEERLAGVPA